MSKKEKILKELGTFTLLTIVFSSLFYYLIMQQGTIKSPGNVLMFGLMWCPGLAALTTQWLYHKKFDTSILRLPTFRYAAVSYILPLMYSLFAYSVIWLTGWGALFDPRFLTVVTQRYGFLPVSEIQLLFFHIVYAMTVGLVIKSVFTLGEELGWRGFLVPKLLQITSITKTAFISGCIWAIWHYPIIIFADYHGKAPVIFTLVCFTLMIIGLSFLLTWLFVKTKSVWPAVILHASHNLFIQQIFNPLTKDTGITQYFIGEFGLGAAVIGIILTFVFWKIFLATEFKP